MDVHYIQLKSGHEAPDVGSFKPFRAIVVIEEAVDKVWQRRVSDWLVKSGCLYMLAWGLDSGSWDDSVDWANIDMFDNGDIPENQSVMTTWHENQPLNEAFEFSKQWAIHPTVELKTTLIIHISSVSRENDLLSLYKSA